MVFDPFCIDRGGRRIDADRQEKVVNDLVSFAGGRGQPLATRCQLNGTVALCRDEVFFLKTCDDTCDGHVADGKMPSQINHAAFPLFRQNRGNGLDVVFRGFRRVIAAGPPIGISGVPDLAMGA